ncbi:MAG TPA: hypothetical protein H9796_09150 [Candidatus Butyricimonas faecavium]|nr:hypothetical protein [Candidatus Butyricimonas faecavium]
MVKAKIVFKSKKKSVAQRVQQLHFKKIIQLAYTFYQAIIVGFPGDSRVQARRVFIK